MRFGDFINVIDRSGETNDMYIVGRNHLLKRGNFTDMLKDVGSPEGFLDPKTMNCSNVKMWIGPRGTVTPLHHDKGSVFLAQISGRKQVKLISPFHLLSLRNDPATCYSEVLLDEPIDLERYPELHNIPIDEGEIGPGDFLFLPVAWWHWVRSLDASISLTFKNFVYKTHRIAWNYR
ncbi:hypothetical protein ADM96_35310 [Burkholderia sp. ST111]|nr:hypothetical protein ADM96_35310 [Burkholderia sp. ST111]